MTRRTTSLMAAALLIVLASALAAQQPAGAASIDALMGAAMHQQEVEGNLPAAAEIYKRVVSDARASRPVQAKALSQLARINEKLSTPDARSQYERLVRDFPEETGVVMEARKRLAALGQPLPAAPEGAAAEQTTRKVWSRYSPFWGVSSDGRFLTFGSGNNLFVRDTANGGERQVTRGGLPPSSTSDPEYPNDARFSRDGRYLTYGWKRSSGYQLRVIAVDGSNERTVTNNPEHEWIGPVDWSSDGARVLAKINSRGNIGQIAWVSLKDGTVQVLKTVPWADLGRVALSPDGRHIAFDQRSADKPATRSIFVLSADASQQVALTDGSSRDDVTGWLPDGGGLAFVTYRSGTPQLWLQPWKDGRVAGAARVLKRDLGAIEPLGFAKDGSLFYTQIVSTGDAYVASIDWDAGRVVEPRKISSNVVADGGTAWSPDGSQVAYIAHRGTEVRRRFVVVHTLKDGTSREVVPSEDLLIQTTGGHKWSPDGTAYLVNGANGSQSSTTFAMDLRTGTLRPLVNFTNAYAQIPQWLKGGRALLSLVRDQFKPAASVFVFDLESGTKQPLHHGFESMRAGGFLASPDERTVAFVVASDAPPSVLRLMPLAGGPSRVLVEAPGYGLWPTAWTPDSQRLLYSRGDRARNQAGNPRAPSERPHASFWFVPVGGGEPRQLVFPQAAPGTLDIHPDGRRITYSVADNEIEVWAIERLTSTTPVSR